MNKKIIITISAVIIVVLIVINIKDNNQGSTGDSYKVGLIAPFTGSAAIYGEPGGLAALMAAKEINAAGGINGKMLDLIAEDGKCEGVAATGAASKLINVDKVNIILGGHCSTETLSIAPLAEKAGVVALASITSSPDVTNSGDYIFRNFPSSKFYTGKSAELAMDRGYNKVAIIYELKDFPKGAAQVIYDDYLEMEGEVVFNESFPSDADDFRTQLLKIDQTNPDIVAFISQGPDLSVMFLRQMNELGLLDKYPVLAGTPTVSTAVNENTGGLLNNPNIFTVDTYVDPENEGANAFIQRYEDEYGTLPGTTLFYVSSSYDAVYLMKDAIEACEGDNPECIRDFLYEVEDWEGTGGTSLTIDHNGDAYTSLALHYFDEEGNEVWEVVE